TSLGWVMHSAKSWLSEAIRHLPLMSSQIGQGLFALVGENFLEEYWLFKEVIIFDLLGACEERSQ
ncbi:hypothetical protein, partial [Pseudanabaena sp. 'Roaring Creek']|uniref:hypothetical protein n=1 Tax=Pseudanabaena sp. 'Roaring Creek' TaxID=1681830 RepID=UPI001E3843FE